MIPTAATIEPSAAVRGPAPRDQRTIGTGPASPVADEGPMHPYSRRARGLPGVINLVARKRALATSIIVFLLLAGNLLLGTRPRDVFDLGDPWTIAGTWLVVLGVAMRSWAGGTLHKATALTTGGPYRLVRHPLYFGSYAMMLGFCVLLGGWLNFLAVLGPILAIYILRLRREERTLSQRFGPAWEDYARLTPRFIPRTWRTNGLADWRVSLWLRNREYRAVVAAAAALAALQLWHNAG